MCKRKIYEILRTSRIKEPLCVGSHVIPTMVLLGSVHSV